MKTYQVMLTIQTRKAYTVQAESEADARKVLAQTSPEPDWQESEENSKVFEMPATRATYTTAEDTQKLFDLINEGIAKNKIRV